MMVRPYWEFWPNFLCFFIQMFTVFTSDINTRGNEKLKYIFRCVSISITGKFKQTNDLTNKQTLRYVHFYNLLDSPG